MNRLARWVIVGGWCLSLLASGVGAADVIPVTITNVGVPETYVTSVRLTWDTDVPATTEVDYGPTIEYGQTARTDPRLTTTHSVHLSGLTPNTLYHYRVRSVDGSGNPHSSTDGTFTTAAVPGGSTLYGASAGFSTAQGTNQWTYRDSNGPMGTVLTSGQVVTDFGPTWRGGEPYALLWATGGHPGGSRDVIRRWTAPADGTVAISGVAHTYAPASTDGVRIQVKQGSTILYERLWGPNDWSTAGWFLPAVPVTAGSTLDFVINRGGATNNSDAAFFDPAIVFTPPAPVAGISNVTASDLRVTSVRITWDTDVAGSTEVEYGATAAYGQTGPVDSTAVTTHSVHLGGLAPNTQYHYRVKSTDGTTTVVSNDATFTTAAVPGGSTLYAASADFATTQGMQQWSYRDGAGLLQPGATSGSVYAAVGPYWVGSEPYVLLWNDGGHPGTSTDAIRRWTAPVAGSVQISGVVYLEDTASADGVRTTVRHNGTPVTERIIGPGDFSTSGLAATVEVAEGDTIDFVINKNGAGNANDATYFNPAIVLTAPVTGGISAVTASQLRPTTALITWQTSEPGTTEVEFGTTTGYGSSAWKDPRLTTTHSVHLSGLTPNTLYHYRVTSVGATTVQSTDRTFTTAAVPGGSTLYGASAGFSTAQGTNQWTYRDSNGPMGTVLTSGQVVTDFGPTWRGGEPYALLWAAGGHPGGSRDVIRRWTAPADGTVAIWGVAHTYAPASTDGVRIQVKQGSTILYERLWARNDWSTGGWFLPAVPVTAGSTLDFVINRGGATNNSDAAFFDPAIVFTPPAPVAGISNVTASDLRVTSARITWTTDVAGSTEVEYGATTAYGQTGPVDPTATTTHSLHLGGLTPNTVYHYRVKSVGATTVISNDATFTTAAVPGGSTLYAASADFATTQGMQQWSYRDGAGLLQPGATSGSVYAVVGPYWVGSDPLVLLWNDGGHPGTSTDAIRRWTAPVAGSVQISGVVYLDDTASADGVRTTVRHNGTPVTERIIGPGDFSTSGLAATVEVAEGDTIDFVINKNGAGNAHDATYFNPAIVLTAPVTGGISAVTASQLRPTTALITWQTSEPGTTEVEFGPGGYGQTAWRDPRLTTTHSVHLSGLTPNTLYHYRVTSVGATTVQSTDRTFTTAAVPGGSTLYGASAGFSTAQGTNQWTYRDSNGPMGTVLTSGQVVTDFGPTWRGGEPYALLWAAGGHPGGSRDVIRRWTAPADGTVAIWGVAHTYAPASTDGVRIQVKQGSTILYERLWGPNDWSTAGWFLPAVPVTAGSTLDFVINRGGATNNSDAAFFDPAIVFTPTALPPSGISNVTASDLRVTSARITWDTAAPGTTEVEYGETGGPTLTAWVDPVLRTTHSLYLGGLTPNTVYHYRVKSTDGTGTSSTSNDATFTTAAVPAGSTLYGASLDFATTQPFKQWTYRESGGPMTIVQTSGLIFDFHGPNWRGSEEFVSLWNDGGHPGQFVDAVRRWTAPQSGNVDISAMAHAIHPDETDGVLLTIRKNGSALATRLFALNDWTTDVLLASASVQAGDTIDFVLNKYGANYYSDSTYFNPAVVFTPASPDLNPPVITSLTSNGRVTSAAITWTTDEPATSEVEYGLSPGSYGETAWADPRPSTAHRIFLANLTPGVTYYFQVRSTDGAGNPQTEAGQFQIPVVPVGQALYAASEDFALQQGFQGWTYRDAAGEWTSTIASGPIFDINGPTWKGSENFALLWATGGHPGGSSDAIRRWTAPQAGQARIDGVAHSLHPDDPLTDGVRVRILVNGVERASSLIASGDFGTYGFDFSVPVAAGDTIDFVINKGGANNSGDATFFSPGILLGPPIAP